MKRTLLLAALSLTTIACTDIPPGHVGILVQKAGSDAGKISEVPVGRIHVGINEELFLFPTYRQNVVWTKSVAEGKPVDESITFQTTEGLSVSADFGADYTIEAGRAKDVFTTYRRGVEEITDIFLRNAVRDALVKRASTVAVESVYGAGKAQLLDGVLKDVQEVMKPVGITVHTLFVIGDMRLPQPVIDAIDAKIKATQDAQRVENEVRATKAEAEKAVAKAEGEAKAILAVATAQAAANQKLSASISSTLVEYEKVKRWNGQNPQVVGGGGAGAAVVVTAK